VNDDLLHHDGHLFGTRETHATREILDPEIWMSTVRDVTRETAPPRQALRTLILLLLVLGHLIVAVETSDEGVEALQDVAGTSMMTETDIMIHVTGCQSNVIDSEVGRLPDGKSETFGKSETSTGGFLESTTLTLAQQAL
jgi:hypothetical protein